jgi:hypothetical protein
MSKKRNLVMVRTSLLLTALCGLLSFCAAPQQLGTVPVNNSGLQTRLLVASELTGGARLHPADQQGIDAGAVSEETVTPPSEPETVASQEEVTADQEIVVPPAQLMPDRDH